MFSTSLRLILCAAIVMSAFGLRAPAFSQNTTSGPKWVHGLSLFGDLKYPAGFKNFNYVNVNAPKGGEVRLGTSGTYDSLNPFIIKGAPASGLGLTYDMLTTQSYDEPFAMYGLVAESMRHPADKSWVEFRLRKEARFHDGRPITPEDIIFSFNTLKEKGAPLYRFYYANVVKVEKTGAHSVRFRFNVKNNRELPLIMGELPILPRHYWLGKDASGKARRFEETTLEKPLGSGPYRIAQAVPGRSIVYERVPNYWGRDLAVSRGQNNFNRIRYDYYRDEAVELEAFKAGRSNFRIERSAKNWATAYKNLPAVKNGAIKLEVLKEGSPARMQGFVFNLRREKFKNRWVRRAFNYAFDFEWMNQNTFFGQYQRLNSYFYGSPDLASSGVPKGDALALLKPYRDQLPKSVFTRPFKNPTGGEARLRKNLRTAQRLLELAGWKVKNGVLTNVQTGEKMKVEFLSNDPTDERLTGPYIQALKRLGVQASVRVADSAQYQNRLRDYDFDIIIDIWAQSESPGNEQREYWGCKAANSPGSRNTGGICDPVIDKLIEKVIFVSNRQELVTATHTLDRALLHNYYLVPHFTRVGNAVAHAKTIKRPARLPAYAFSFPAIWWYEAAK